VEVIIYLKIMVLVEDLVMPRLHVLILQSYNEGQVRPEILKQFPQVLANLISYRDLFEVNLGQSEHSLTALSNQSRQFAHNIFGDSPVHPVLFLVEIFLGMLYPQRVVRCEGQIDLFESVFKVGVNVLLV